MKPIIKVEKLSKQYRIGVRQAPYGTLRDTIANSVRAPLEALRRYRHADETIWALKDVSFEIRPGEVVGIVGRNGAGKSTLLKVLSRITEPTSGRVELYGRVASLLEVGTGFHPELTGRENIFLNAAILGMKRTEIKRKFDEIVAFAEIERFLDTPVKHYSSGMYMRLAFAVAAHLEPEILIVDEVLAVGDANFQNKCLGKMGEVAKQGRTVLFVSHQMGAVAQLCSTAFLMGQGGIVKSGDTPSVIDYYLSETPSAAKSEFIASKNANKEISIGEARAFSSQGKVTSQFLHNEQIIIGITYLANNLVSGAYRGGFNVGFNVTDKTGRVVFRAETIISAEECQRRGAMRITATIPSHTLVPGRYFFTFFIHIPFVKILDNVEDAFTITISDAGSKFLMYEGKVDYGCVFVDCEWTMENHFVQEAKVDG
jgi:homopolymeric O-antigen transport system ATP-binding protein